MSKMSPWVKCVKNNMSKYYKKYGKEKAMKKLSEDFKAGKVK